MGRTIAQKKWRSCSQTWHKDYATAVGDTTKAYFIPQQRKPMGSAAQISSGVCRCGSQEQVPKEGSGRFRRVPVRAGVGFGGKFRKVPEGSGVCWCGFRKVVEGSGEFRCGLV